MLIGAILLALIVSASQSQSLAASGQLVLDRPVEGVMAEAGQSVALALGYAPLDYVRGRLESGSGHFDLDLVTGDGRHLRRLLEDATGGNDFQFVLEDEDVAVKLTARSAGASYNLRLTTHVTPEQQQPPAAEFLSPMIAALAAAVEKGGSTDAFWSRMETDGTPLIEPRDDGSYVATFLWRGARKNVRLFGAPSGNHENLQRLGGSDVWFKSFVVPAETRLSYQLAPDVPDIPGTARERRVAILSTAQEDPLNPHSWPADGIDRFSRDSILELPNAPPEPYLGDQGYPKGSLSRLSVRSETLGNEREITIYRPANFDPESANLLFVFDAQQMLTIIPTPEILDNMIGAGVIPPTVAVFIANPGADARASELPANPVFADFMAEQLVPLVLKETGLKHDPVRTALAGASYGGLASMTIAMRHPDLFGNVLSMSGSFWWSPPGTPADRQDHVALRVAEEGVPPLKIFMSAGLFEADASKGVGSIIDTNRHLRNVLLAKGNHVFYREYAGGHDWLIWRTIIADGLVALFGRQS